MAKFDQQKRRFRRRVGALGAMLAAGSFTPGTGAAPLKTTHLTAEQALQVLKDGNARFMADKPEPVPLLEGDNEPGPYFI